MGKQLVVQRQQLFLLRLPIEAVLQRAVTALAHSRPALGIVQQRPDGGSDLLRLIRIDADAAAEIFFQRSGRLMRTISMLSDAFSPSSAPVPDKTVKLTV